MGFQIRLQVTCKEYNFELYFDKVFVLHFIVTFLKNGPLLFIFHSFHNAKTNIAQILTVNDESIDGVWDSNPGRQDGRR